MDSLPWFISFILISALAGAVSALATIVWIAPDVVYNTSSYPIPRASRQLAEKIELDPSFVNTIQQQHIRIYNTKKQINNYVYTSSAFISDSVLLSSDGWSALYYPKYIKDEEKNWQGIGFQGNIYLIDQSILDKESGILYIKWQGNGFRIATFPNKKETKDNDQAWIISYEDWQQVNLEKINNPQQELVQLSKLNPIFETNTQQQIGSIVINQSGEILGFIKEDGKTIVPYLFVEFALPQILENGKIEYKNTNIPGQYIDGYTKNDRFIKQTGFLLSQSIKNSNLISKDIILSINKQPLTQDYSAWDLLFSSNKTTVTIIRNEQEIEASL